MLILVYFIQKNKQNKKSLSILVVYLVKERRADLFFFSTCKNFFRKFSSEFDLHDRYNALAQAGMIEKNAFECNQEKREALEQIRRTSDDRKRAMKTTDFDEEEDFALPEGMTEEDLYRMIEAAMEAELMGLM